MKRPLLLRYLGIFMFMGYSATVRAQAFKVVNPMQAIIEIKINEGPIQIMRPKEEITLEEVPQSVEIKQRDRRPVSAYRFGDPPVHVRIGPHRDRIILTATRGQVFPITQDIFDAIKQGNLETVKEILNKNPEAIKAKHEKQNWTPLHMAVYEGKKDIARFLLDKGADVKATEDWGFTPLHYVIPENVRFDKIDEKAVKELAELLMSRGANINAKNINEITPLSCASYRKLPTIVSFFINKGANPNPSEDALFSPLGVAIYRGPLERTLEKKAENEVKKRSREIVKILLKNGANVNADILIEAINPMSGTTDEQLIKLLIDKNPNSICQVHSSGSDTPLRNALIYERESLAKLFLAKIDKVVSFIPEEDWDEGESELHLAIMYLGNTNIPQLLIEKGAGELLASKDKRGNTPLHYAASENLKNLVKYLVKKGADVTAKNNEGETPADFATDKEIQEFLQPAETA